MTSSNIPDVMQLESPKSSDHSDRLRAEVSKKMLCCLASYFVILTKQFKFLFSER